MFSGLAFMVDGKICICANKDSMLIRFDPARHEELAEKNGFEEMKTKTHTYKGYGFIDSDILKSKKEFNFWVSLALDFNPKAKASKKKK